MIESEVGWNREIIVPISMQMLYRYRDFFIGKIERSHKMIKKITLQEMILRLQKFWSDNDCMIMQAYDTEKGAGTMSPYTFLRAIGPEPCDAHRADGHETPGSVL